MSFPLIIESFPLTIEGYTKNTCGKCSFWHACAGYYKCDLFGVVKGYTETVTPKRHKRCIQMEQKYKEKKDA